MAIETVHHSVVRTRADLLYVLLVLLIGGCIRVLHLKWAAVSNYYRLQQ